MYSQRSNRGMFDKSITIGMYAPPASQHSSTLNDPQEYDDCCDDQQDVDESTCVKCSESEDPCYDEHDGDDI